MSDAYTHGHHDSVLRSHRWRTAENSAAYLLPHLRPGMRVLDVGAGPGTITVDLARLVAPGTVLGVDASADIVATAAAHAAEEAVANVEFAVGDAYALDAGNGAFDVVHAHQVLQHLARPVDALREFARVVSPDGVVAARGTPAQGVGTRRGLRRRHLEHLDVAVRDTRGPRVVGWRVGGARSRVRLRPPRRRPRHRRPRRAGAHRRGLARVGGIRRRLAHDAARRDPRPPRLTRRAKPSRGDR